MKLQKIKKLNFKLIKLEIIKLKVHLQKKEMLNNPVCVFDYLELIELNLKHVLRVIYYNHISNKKIIFVGIPRNLQEKFLKILNKTNHICIPQNTWINGVLSNQASIYMYIKKHLGINKRLAKLFQIKTKPDLIVIFNAKNESGVLQEAQKLKIPTITLNLESNYEFDSLYDVPGNFKFLNKRLNNILFILLNSIFKK